MKAAEVVAKVSRRIGDVFPVKVRSMSIGRGDGFRGEGEGRGRGRGEGIPILYGFDDSHSRLIVQVAVVAEAAVANVQRKTQPKNGCQ